MEAFLEYIIRSGDGTFQAFYAKDLRGDLFGGCMTFSGFLFAAYTFIVVHMKTYVFEDAKYQKRFEEHKKVNGELKLYQPLRKLSNALIRGVWFTLVAGLLQFTLGFIEANCAAWFCTLFALAAAGCVIHGVLIMAGNMRSWLDLLDDSD